MRKLNIKEVIKAIPMEEKVREQLLSEYESYPEIKQFDISLGCWNTFHQMQKIMEDAKFQEYEQEILNGTRQATALLMQEARDSVWQDIEDVISGKKIEEKKIEAIRAQLQSLIKK